jgi:phospholipid-binding lipoprotein MlaA
MQTFIHQHHKTRTHSLLHLIWLESSGKKEKGMNRSFKYLIWDPSAMAIGLVIGLLAITNPVQAEPPAQANDGPYLDQVVIADATDGSRSLSPGSIPAPAAAAAPGEDFDEDPWEGFNEKMFDFNREILDRYLLKPIATAWDFVLPDMVQRGVHNMLDNVAVVRRVVNNSLQAKFTGAGIEVARFTINSTIGIAGFFDVAKDAFGIEQKDEDTGQTFGVWGMGPGPYLVLPFLPPLTVRDGIGYAFDAAMTPYAYFIPWWGSVTATGTNTVNERSINLDRFERVAESTVDLYGAVRNAYLQRRAAAIKQ